MFRRTLREVKSAGAGQILVDCSYQNIRKDLLNGEITSPSWDSFILNIFI